MSKSVSDIALRAHSSIDNGTWSFATLASRVFTTPSAFTWVRCIPDVSFVHSPMFAYRTCPQALQPKYRTSCFCVH
eukprot:692218-Rhodomonas_salina.1